MSNASQATQDPATPPIDFSKRVSRASRPDGQYIDEVRIVTVPRFKESELSGDEWRISGKIEFYRKGILIGTDTFRNVETCARFLDWAMTRFRENSVLQYPAIDQFCDQEGCNEQATITYKVKQSFCNAGHASPITFGTEVRRFCERHKHRGDCGLDDADDNYEPFDGVA